MIGIGLVYQGTGHRHNAEVLLSEIGEYIFIYINTNIYIKIYLHKYIYIYIFSFLRTTPWSRDGVLYRQRVVFTRCRTGPGHGLSGCKSCYI